MQVIRVERWEALSLRKRWMNDLSHGVAFLESLNLAHGDLRPENVLLDRNRLKLSDFDCTAVIGSEFEACIAPYGRLLGSEGGEDRGTAGRLGPRTEQFALGSLYYLINYGFEVYGDQNFGDQPFGNEHGPVVLDLLQKMMFPELNGEPVLDSIIKKCWYGKYRTVAELAVDTERFCNGEVEASSVKTQSANGSDHIYKHDFLSRRKLCADLAGCGMLEALGSRDPRQIGLSIERRYVCWDLLHA